MSRRSTLAVLAALVCAVGAALVWALAFRTDRGHFHDMVWLLRAEELSGTRARTPLRLLALLCNTGPYALLGLAVIATAFRTRGPSGALVVAAMLVVPNAVTQVLKVTTAEDRVHTVPTTLMHVDAASWPSGHATAAMALALCATFAAPAALRRLVAVLGLAYAAAVGAAVVVLGWHFPSDVAGGFLVAATGACLGAAVLSRRETTTAPAVRWHPARG